MQKGPWGTELFVTTARRQYRQFVSFHSASLHHLYPPNYRTFLQPHRYKAVKQRLEATNLKSSESRDMLFTTSALILVALTSQVTAHGYVPQIKIGSNYYPGWNVNTDPYTNPPPTRIVRRTKSDSGFISDVTSGDITCSIGNSYLSTTPISATVAAGQTVTVLWNSWPVGHYGVGPF
ncbi:Esterase/lipase/thioesterase [Tulasnella sp. 418]|nr:Esterase/lipase/thioesterase [Tulasnella sp. 418]